MYIQEKSSTRSIKWDVVAIRENSNITIHIAGKAIFGRVPFTLIHSDTELED